MNASTDKQGANGLSLAELIDRHADETGQLVECLEQERLALMGNDIPALERICASKLACVTQLQTLGRELHRLTRGIGVETLAATDPAALALLPAWRQLMTLASRCQDLNLANGDLLEQRQSQVRRLIGGLTAPLDESATYGRAGTRTFNPLRRVLASA